MDELLKDARFAHIAKDPKFRHIPKTERKVKIDKRFQGMFKDKKFTVTYTTDKRGRPVNQTTTENLRKYYDLSSNEEEEESDGNTSVLSETKKIKKKGSTKNTKNKEIKKKKTIAKETDTNSLNKKSKDEQSNDKYFSSNENLLEIKPKEKHNQHFDDKSDESSSEDNEDKCIEEGFSQVDLDENEKQLHKKEKNESSEFKNELKKKLKDLSVNYARGEGVLLTDGSSEEESPETSDDEEEIEHNWGELDKEAERTDDITYRLAICNMNWDVIRAVDLMILLNSFLPSGGLLRSVTIYPSEYGQQRMKEEEINGPMELKNSDIDSDSENEDNEEGAKYDMEKLRRYQLNRLKYYYAVAEFDSTETANKVYMECDGIEYESTANRLDLRFIPDDMTFDQEPKDTCSEIPEPAKYQPRQFTTTALQQVKVDLTWDDVDPDRQEFIQKANSGKLEDMDENDLHKYLASGSEDDLDAEEKKGNEVDNNLDSNVKNDPIEKYKTLLRSIEEEEKEEMKKKQDVELEVSWDIGAKEKVDKLVKEKTKSNEELTPFEQYLEKRKAKKKTKREEKRHKKESQNNDSKDSLPSDIDMNDKYFAEELKNGKSLSRKKEEKDDENNSISNNEEEEEEDQHKAELELLLMDEDEDNGKKHFNMKEIEENAALSKSKRKRLSKKKNAQEKTKEDTFEVDVKDPRFGALFTSYHFNIDPADPHYRKTKGTNALINEKLKRRADNVAHVEDGKQFKKPRTNEKLPTELQALVKSVKRKTQNIIRPIKR